MADEEFITPPTDSDPVPEAPEVAATADEELPTEDAAEATDDTEAEEKPPEPALPKGVQRRIDRAVRQKYEAEARAKMLEERIAYIEQQTQSRQPANNLPQQRQAPNIEQFTNFNDYVTATAEYIADQRIQSTLTERENAQRAANAEAERARTATEWQKRVQQTAAELPDFEDVLGASDLPMTGIMQDAIMESDLGPKLAYHLATNPEEAVRIAQMTPMGQVRALGRLEERLVKAPKTIQATQAPAPIKPASGRTNVSRDPDSMSAEEWVAWRNKQIAAKRA